MYLERLSVAQQNRSPMYEETEATYDEESCEYISECSFDARHPVAQQNRSPIPWSNEKKDWPEMGS